MPQNPTPDAQPEDKLGNFSGLNDQQDSVYRPAGTVTDMRNMIDEQGGDASRRFGRDFDRLEDNPIGVIYQLVWNDGSTSINVSNGGDLTYDDFQFPSRTVSVSNPSTPGPMPNRGTYRVTYRRARRVPDFTSLMRALSEARIFATHGSDISPYWRARIWSFDVYRNSNFSLPPIATNIRDRNLVTMYRNRGLVLRRTLAHGTEAAPTPGTSIPNDWYWVDYFIDINLAVTDLNTIIGRAQNLVAPDYVSQYPIVGSASISTWAPGTFFNETATFANYRDLWSRLANKINTQIVRIKLVTSAPLLTSQKKSARSQSPARSVGLAKLCVQSKYGSATEGVSGNVYDADSGCALTSTGTIDATVPGLVVDSNNLGAPYSVSMYRIPRQITADASLYVGTHGFEAYGTFVSPGLFATDYFPPTSFGVPAAGRFALIGTSNPAEISGTLIDNDAAAVLFGAKSAPGQSQIYGFQCDQFQMTVLRPQNFPASGPGGVG